VCKTSQTPILEEQKGGEAHKKIASKGKRMLAIPRREHPASKGRKESLHQESWGIRAMESSIRAKAGERSGSNRSEWDNGG